jgi:hypothetical protein
VQKEKGTARIEWLGKENVELEKYEGGKEGVRMIFEVGIKTSCRVHMGNVKGLFNEHTLPEFHN